jgi:hypothetical protein
LCRNRNPNNIAIEMHGPTGPLAAWGVAMAESDFWQALSDTIHRAVNLRVVTLVGDSVVSGTLERLEVGAPVASAGALVTDINLAGGDITRIVSDKLLGADYADLRAAHQDSVKQAQDIVERNISILVSLVKDIGHQLGALPTPTAGPIRTVQNVANPAVPVTTPPQQP